MPFPRIPVKTNTEYREGGLERMGHSAKGERNHGKGTMSSILVFIAEATDHRPGPRPDLT